MASTRPRTAVVTGANRGLGLETCRQLLRLGYRVVLTGRDLARTAGAAAQLGVPGDRAMALEMNVRDSGSIERAYRAATERIGPIDVLVNNAAVLVNESSDVLSIPSDDFRNSFDTNVFGVVDVCRAFVPDMAKRKYGRVVNVSSGVGQFSRIGTYAPAYSMSKVALNALTLILAATHRESGVLVNAVDPG